VLLGEGGEHRAVHIMGVHSLAEIALDRAPVKPGLSLKVTAVHGAQDRYD
jgi:hypothetical protein